MPIILFCINGRVVLASNLIALYRVDKNWSRFNLIPLFNWGSHPNVARDMWISFLYSPQIYWPLLSELKDSLIETSAQYESLGNTRSRQFTAFLTYAALASDRTIKVSEYRLAFRQLPNPALADVAHTLYRATKGSGDQSSEFLSIESSRFLSQYGHEIWMLELKIFLNIFPSFAPSRVLLFGRHSTTSRIG